MKALNSYDLDSVASVSSVIFLPKPTYQDPCQPSDTDEARFPGAAGAFWWFRFVERVRIPPCQTVRFLFTLHHPEWGGKGAVLHSERSPLNRTRSQGVRLPVLRRPRDFACRTSAVIVNPVNLSSCRYFLCLVAQPWNGGRFCTQADGSDFLVLFFEPTQVLKTPKIGQTGLFFGKGRGVLGGNAVTPTGRYLTVDHG